MEPLGHHGSLRQGAHGLVVLSNRRKERRSEGRVGQIDLEGGGALEMAGAPVDPVNHPDQEGCFQILEVLA